MAQYAFTTNADLLRAIAPEVADRFQALRREVRDAGPIEAKTRELILLAAFAAADIKSGFVIHARIARTLGATIEECRHAAMLGISATQSLARTVDAIEWVEAAFDDNEGRTK
jgi:4-carboxymuconolactone decarboxylase